MHQVWYEPLGNDFDACTCTFVIHPCEWSSKRWSCFSHAYVVPAMLGSYACSLRKYDSSITLETCLHDGHRSLGTLAGRQFYPVNVSFSIVCLPNRCSASVFSPIRYSKLMTWVTGSDCDRKRFTEWIQWYICTSTIGPRPTLFGREIVYFVITPDTITLLSLLTKLCVGLGKDTDFLELDSLILNFSVVNWND